jgi:hypothetical protein
VEKIVEDFEAVSALETVRVVGDAADGVEVGAAEEKKETRNGSQ